eukprot:Awhi_evm1s11761
MFELNAFKGYFFYVCCKPNDYFIDDIVSFDNDMTTGNVKVHMNMQNVLSCHEKIPPGRRPRTSKDATKIRYTMKECIIALKAGHIGTISVIEGPIALGPITLDN